MNKGTDAHTIVCEFMTESGVKKTNFPRHMAQAKRLLNEYTKEDILYAIKIYGSKMYSLGYLTEERMFSAIAKRQQETMVLTTVALNRGEDIAERNKRKLQRIYSQPGFGKRDSFDLLGK